MTKEETKIICLKFLKDNKTAVLATATSQGKPQAATVFYAIDDDFTFNFVANNKSRKFKNLQENPDVAIVVGTGPDVMTVQCGGRAEILDSVKNAERFHEIVGKVMRNAVKHQPPPQLPVLMYPDKEFAAFVVRPEWMVLLNLEYQKHKESYLHDYQEILP